MTVRFASHAPLDSDAPLLAALVPDVTSLPDELAALDGELGGALTRELERKRLREGKGDSIVVTGGSRGPQRVLLLGLPSLDQGRGEAVRIVGARIAASARALRATQVELVCPRGGEGSDEEDVALVVEGFGIGAYRYDRFKGAGKGDDGSDGDGDDEPGSKFELTVLGAGDGEREAAERAAMLAGAVNFARDLANAPANHMTPELLAAEAEQLASQHEHLTFHALDRAAIEAKGMGLLAGVAQGSVNEPRMIVLEWNPPEDTRADGDRLALVGKAVTFDTGGISIKPSAGMTEMKMDKSGGCAVIGAMRAIAELGVPRRVLAVVGSTENMPDGKAYKPGDVLTAYDGTTIEITNTDAEGRLVLGDAITYARELGCAKIVEASTLTGAMVIALGHYFTGVVARDNEFTSAVLDSARNTGDHAWHLPMHDAYKGQLKSDCADMQNSGGRAGGSLYAGLFLEHFAKDTPFVHLDVAGTAMLPKPQTYYGAKGASGWGVRLFADLAAHS